MALCKPFEHHCFISYTTRDDEGAAAKAIAERLANEVGSLASDVRFVWIDAFHLGAFKDLQVALANGVDKSICLIGMVSPLYLTSEWCEMEWLRMVERGDPACVAPLIWKHVENFYNPAFRPGLSRDVAKREPLRFPERSRAAGPTPYSPPSVQEWQELAKDVLRFVRNSEKHRCHTEA